MRIIAHLSDLHFGRHDPAKAAALIESLAQNRPDIVAISGDFTQRARRQEFEDARRFLDSIAAPKLVVPGNHDVPLYNVVKRWQSALRNYDRHIAPAGIAGGFFADDEIALLGLNTARRLTWKGGRISYSQMERIRSTLAGLPSPIWKILVTHHPLAFAVGETPVALAGRSTPALRVIEQAGVHLLLSGHYHSAVSGAVSAELIPAAALLVVHAGTAISTRTRGAHANSYNLIRTDAHRLTVNVMEWSGRTYRQTSSAAFALAGGRLLPEGGADA